jgi:hypothetical protein
MSQILRRILELIEARNVRISDHGYDELANDGLLLEDILASVNSSVVVEDYPDYHKGSCVLVLQTDIHGLPIHVLWGIPRGADSPAVLITAYRPDPERWSENYLRRKS